MKHISKLQFLFFIVVLLIGICALLFQFQKSTGIQQTDDNFYCGTTSYPTDSTGRSIHEAGEQLFKENCKSCHKIHEASVGPALLGVTARRPKKWIYAFIHNSDSLIHSGDTMAVNLFEQFNKAQMTHFPTLTESEIDSILIYIEASPLPFYTDVPRVMVCP